MNRNQFKVWLAINGYDQKTLAEKLGITAVTISVYNRNNRYPLIFQYALKGLEKCN